LLPRFHMVQSMSVIEDTNASIRQLLIVAGICVGVVVVAYYILPPSYTTLRIIVAFPLLAALIYCSAMMLIIYRRAEAPLPVALFLAGAAYVIGGATFDIVTTVIRTPSLQLEANPVARVLLDNGFAVSFVYLFGGIGQALIAILNCLLWAAFLRHVPEVVKSAKAKDPSSTAVFIKAAGGADHLSWRQWFFPLSIRELPRAYHSLWLCVVVWMGALIGRWYLGLAWLGIIHLNLIVVALVGMLVSLTIYFLWLARQYNFSAEQSVTAD
jgi:hypothetical protein